MIDWLGGLVEEDLGIARLDIRINCNLETSYEI
jgi:hypothetical protein